MIITNVGRPVAKFDRFKWKDGEGGYLLILDRIDVSDVGNETKAEPFYTPIIAFDDRDGMKTITIRMDNRLLIIFLAPRRISFYVTPKTSE